MSVSFFLSGWGVGYTLYVVVQIAAVFTLHGRYRLIGLIPLPFMLAVLGWTVYAENRGGNLWPVVMILTSPVAVLVVILMGVLYRLDQKRSVASRQV